MFENACSGCHAKTPVTPCRSCAPSCFTCSHNPDHAASIASGNCQNRSARGRFSDDGGPCAEYEPNKKAAACLLRRLVVEIRIEAAGGDGGVGARSRPRRPLLDSYMEAVMRGRDDLVERIERMQSMMDSRETQRIEERRCFAAMLEESCRVQAHAMDALNMAATPHSSDSWEWAEEGLGRIRAGVPVPDTEATWPQLADEVLRDLFAVMGAVNCDRLQCGLKAERRMLALPVKSVLSVGEGFCDPSVHGEASLASRLSDSASFAQLASSDGSVAEFRVCDIRELCGVALGKMGAFRRSSVEHP